jgi:hypothetical protein
MTMLSSIKNGSAKENAVLANRAPTIFSFGASLAIAGLVGSVYIPQLSFLYFFGLLVMVASFVIGEAQSSTIIVAQLAVVSLMVMLVPLLRGFDFAAVPISVLRYQYATEFITQSGHVPLYYPLWESQPYSFWSGSFVLLSSVQQLMGISTETTYMIAGLLASTLIVIMFYLVIEAATGRSRLAALAAVFIALLRPLVTHHLYNSPQYLAYLSGFIALFAIILYIQRKQYKTGGFLVVAAIAACGLIVSHHLTGYFFIIALIALLITVLRGKLSRRTKVVVASCFGFFIIAMAAYWIIAAKPFSTQMLHGAQWAVTETTTVPASPPAETIPPEETITRGTLPSWIPIPQSLLPWVSLPPSRSGIEFFNPVFETAGRISSVVFYLIGVGAFIIVLFKRQWRNMVGLFLLWVFIMGLSYIVAALTPLGNFLDAPRHIIIAAYPLAVLVSLLALQIIKVVPKVAALLICGFFILIITTQGITAFPLDVYGLHHVETGSGPLLYTAQDRVVGQWAKEHTKDSSFFVADSDSSQVLLYGGHREASWSWAGNKRIFEDNIKDNETREKCLYEPVTTQNIALGTTQQVDIDYVMLNIYNKYYGAYADWGLYFNIEQNSVAANIDTTRSVSLVYNDDKSFIYWVHR